MQIMASDAKWLSWTGPVHRPGLYHKNTGMPGKYQSASLDCCPKPFKCGRAAFTLCVLPNKRIESLYFFLKNEYV